MSGIFDQLDHVNVPGFVDLNDFTDPGNFFIDDVSSLNLPAAISGFLGVRRDSSQSRFYQSYLAEANSQLFTRTAAYSNESGGSDEIIFQPYGYDPTIATFIASGSGLFLTASGGTLAGVDGRPVGNDALSGSLLFDIDTTGIGAIVINGTNAISILGGSVSVFPTPIPTGKGILTIDDNKTKVVEGKLEVAFDYQWTAELEERLVWTAWQNCSCECGPEPQFYQINFNADGGEPEPGPLLVVVGTSFVFPNAPLKAGFAFAGWRDDELGVVYQPGDSLIPTESMNFTAQWEAESATDYTITFDSNGGIPNYEPIIVAAGSSFILPESPILTGYTFLGWRDSASDDIFNAGRQITPTDNMVFIAQWRSETEIVEGDINVYFLTEGANFPILKAAEPNSTFTIPNDIPIMEGHTFVKWLSDDFATEYMPGDTFTIAEEDVYLSAVWFIHISDQTTEKMLKSANYMSGTFRMRTENRYFTNNLGCQPFNLTGSVYLDWGDGNVEELRLNSSQLNFTHLYETPGTYHVRAWTDRPIGWWGFGGTAGMGQVRDNLITIDYVKIQSDRTQMGNFASNQVGLERINCPVLWKHVLPTHSGEMFKYCTSLVGKNDFTGHAFNSQTTSSYMHDNFNGCTALDPDWSKKAFSDMPQLTLAFSMFQDCSAMTKAPENHLAGSIRCYEYQNMFLNNVSLKTLPKRMNFNSTTTRSANALNLFSGCSELEGSALRFLDNVPVWNNLSTSGMFRNCRKLEDYDQIPPQFL